MICSLKKQLTFSGAPLFTEKRFGWGIEGRVSSVQPDGIPNPDSLVRELRGRCQNMLSINVIAQNTTGLKYYIQTITVLLTESLPIPVIL